jgi:hypothetical protein
MKLLASLGGVDGLLYELDELNPEERAQLLNSVFFVVYGQATADAYNEVGALIALNR